MLLWLAEYLSQFYSVFGVFQYLTMRAIMGVLTALFIAMAIGPFMIKHLQIRQIGQAIRDDGPQSHLVKAGTPTMGGALILVAIIISALLWGDLSNRYIWVTIFEIESKRVISTSRRAGRPGGLGIKNFWANAIHKVIIGLDRMG